MGIITQIREDKVRYRLTERGVRVSEILEDVLQSLKEVESIIKNKV